jgi:hypothetical protein
MDEVEGRGKKVGKPRAGHLKYVRFLHVSWLSKQTRRV